MELLLVASLAAIDQGTGNMIPRYFIYGIIVVHTILFSIKHKFSYKIFGRILFILGECCLITIFSMFLFQVTYIVDFHLDLFLVAAVLLLDMIYYIAEIVYYCKNGVPKDTDS